MLPRFARVILVGVLAVLFVCLLSLLLGEPSASPVSAGGLPTPTSELAPTATPTEWFSPTVLLTVSAATPTVGDLITVTTHLVTTGTCGFTLYNVTLSQTALLFTYVDPPINMVGPPGVTPAGWRLAARQPGVAAFTVHFYGESRCGGAWQWTTIRGESQPVTVTGVTHFLPFVPRTVPPVRLTDLGTLGGDHSYANSGELQGPVLWKEGGLIPLPGLSDEYPACAQDINNLGRVVGLSSRGYGVAHAVLWETTEGQ